MAQNLFSSRNIAKPQSKKRHLTSFLGKFYRRTTYILGSIVIIYTVILCAGLIILQTKTPSLPEAYNLLLTLNKPIIEQNKGLDGLRFIGDKSYNIIHLIRAINAATYDDSVKSLVVSLHTQSISLGHMSELKEAIELFQASGKKTYIYAHEFGAGLSTGQYYLASVFNEVWMHPLGYVSMTGFSADLPFLGGVLKQLGIEAQIFQREEYKSAFENIVNENISDTNREATQMVLKNFLNTIKSTILENRNIEASQLEQAYHKGLLSASDAVSLGLVDNLGAGNIFSEYISSKNEIPFVSMDQYMVSRSRPKSTELTKIAYIVVDGAITQELGEDDPTGFLEEGSEVAYALRQAAVSDNIKAVLLRINSPGGSPIASEHIRQASLYVQKAGKPVYISMGDVAASGGYWASANADHIYAHETTLTGSIGVVGGKFNIRSLVERFGVNIETIKVGENGDFWSMLNSFSPEQGRAFNQMLDITYENFLKIVSEGRGLKPGDTRKIAKGRVWTGVKAKEIDLIDDIGGISKALDHIALRLGHKKSEDLSLILLPQPKPAIKRIMEAFNIKTGVFLKWKEIFSDFNLEVQKSMMPVGVYL